MTAEKINRLMYRTAMNDIDREKYPIPEHEFWETPIPSLEGALRLRMIRKFVFDLPGKYYPIPHCQEEAKQDKVC